MDLSKYRWSKNGITLRPAVSDDWEHFYNIYFDSETRFMFYTEAEWPENRETAKERFGKFIVSLREKGGMSFACENDNGDVIGSLDLYAVDMRNGTFQIAVMVSKEHRGKGYAKKLLRRVAGRGIPVFLRPMSPSLFDFYKAYYFPLLSLLRRRSLRAVYSNINANIVIPHLENLQTKLFANHIHSIELLPAEELNLAGGLYAVLKYCNLLSVRTIAEVTV